MSKKGNKKGRNEKKIADILLVTAIIDLLIQVIEFISKFLD